MKKILSMLLCVLTLHCCQTLGVFSGKIKNLQEIFWHLTFTDASTLMGITFTTQDHKKILKTLLKSKKSHTEKFEVLRFLVEDLKIPLNTMVGIGNDDIETFFSKLVDSMVNNILIKKLQPEDVEVQDSLSIIQYMIPHIDFKNEGNIDMIFYIFRNKEHWLLKEVLKTIFTENNAKYIAELYQLTQDNKLEDLQEFLKKHNLSTLPECCKEILVTNALRNAIDLNVLVKHGIIDFNWNGTIEEHPIIKMTNLIDNNNINAVANLVQYICVNNKKLLYLKKYYQKQEDLITTLVGNISQFHLLPVLESLQKNGYTFRVTKSNIAEDNIFNKAYNKFNRIYECDEFGNKKNIQLENETLTYLFRLGYIPKPRGIKKDPKKSNAPVSSWTEHSNLENKSQEILMQKIEINTKKLKYTTDQKFLLDIIEINHKESLDSSLRNITISTNN